MTCLQLLDKRKLAEDLQFTIKQKKENIQLLKKLIDERKKHTSYITEKCQQLTVANGYSRKQVPQYVKKCQQFADYIIKMDERNLRQDERKTKLYEDLKLCRVNNIQKLIKYIFPLSQRISNNVTTINANALSISPIENDSPKMNTHYIDNSLGMNIGESGTRPSSDTLNALAEATHTTYIRGRWILQDSHGELQHVIVAPSLPGKLCHTIFLLSCWLFFSFC